MSASLSLQIAGLTDIGRMRKRNEDAIAWDETAALAVLADGMGGHQAGDVASRMATQSIVAALGGHAAAAGSEQCQAISRAVQQLNESVYTRAAENEELAGMGTTLVVLQVAGSHVLVAHIGDSRAYRLRDGSFEQLTHDHSLLNDLLEKGEIQADQMDDRLRNVLTRAVGVREQIEADIRSLPLQLGDIYLLCSDGLHAYVSDDDMTRILKQYEHEPETAARLMVDLANAHGGGDNISVIVASVVRVRSRKPPK